MLPHEYGDAHHDGKKPADNGHDDKLVNHPLLLVLQSFDFVQIQHVFTEVAHKGFCHEALHMLGNLLSALLGYHACDS